MSLSTSATATKSDLPQLLDTLGLAGICLTLIVAFYYQLYLAELPCPLCLLQHSAALPSMDGLPPLAAVQWRGQRLPLAAPSLAPAPLLRHWRPPLRAPPVFSLA